MADRRDLIEADKLVPLLLGVLVEYVLAVSTVLAVLGRLHDLLFSSFFISPAASPALFAASNAVLPPPSHNVASAPFSSNNLIRRIVALDWATASIALTNGINCRAHPYWGRHLVLITPRPLQHIVSAFWQTVRQKMNMALIANGPSHIVHQCLMPQEKIMPSSLDRYLLISLPCSHAIQRAVLPM